MKQIRVVAAVIEMNGKIFCGQRGSNKHEYLSHKWEFPGGKIELNESHEEALIREIREELDIEISVLKHLITVSHQYPDFEIEMDTFLCKQINGEILLKEHIDYKWLAVDDLKKLDWAEADIPIVDSLKQRMN